MKQNFYKLGSVAFILALLVATVGCKKFLDRKPLGVAVDGDLTVGGVEGKVFGLYGKLRDEAGMSDLATLFLKAYVLMMLKKEVHQVILASLQVE